MNLNEMTFIAFSIDNADELAKSMLSELMTVPDECWHFNEFRNCKMLSIYNPGGDIGKVPLGKRGEFMFTQAAIDHCPTMLKFLQDHVFSWMIPHGRVTILRTPPGMLMNEHLDCSINESMTTIRNKWRFVLNGEIDKLYFLDKELNKVYIPATYRCYILDGGHPHSLEVSSVEKFTICIGNPWTGEELSNEYSEYLETSSYMMKVSKPDLISKWEDPILKIKTS